MITKEVGWHERLLFIFLTALSVFALNQYQYGTADLAIDIPFIKDILNPGLYPDDYLVAQRIYLLTFFFYIVSLLIKTTRLPIPIVFFSSYCVAIYFTLLTFYKLGLTITKSKEASLIAVFFLLFPAMVLGSIGTIDVLLIPRAVVIPILVIGINDFLKKKFYRSFLLQGIAFLLHPLSAIYVVGMSAAASLALYKEIGMARLAKCALIFIATIVPLLVWKYLYPAPSLHLISVDPLWLKLMRMRSAHHVFPTEWNAISIIRNALFFSGFIFIQRSFPDIFEKRVITAMTWGVAAMCIAGIVFTEYVPVALAIQLQFFRSLRFLFYLAVLVYCWYFIERSDGLERYIAFSFFLVFFVDLTRFLAIVCFGVVVMFLTSRKQAATRLQYALMVAILPIAVFAFFKRGNFTIETRGEKQWLEVQNWARSQTSKTAVFITPPDHIGFRVESERTVYGEWKDGTEMFFNPAFGRDWLSRMEQMGCPEPSKHCTAYDNLEDNRIRDIAAELRSSGHEVYFVTFAKNADYKFIKVHQNAAFKVYKIN